jgi:hypothetical protein
MYPGNTGFDSQREQRLAYTRAGLVTHLWGVGNRCERKKNIMISYFYENVKNKTPQEEKETPCFAHKKERRKEKKKFHVSYFFFTIPFIHFSLRLSSILRYNMILY